MRQIDSSVMMFTSVAMAVLCVFSGAGCSDADSDDGGENSDALCSDGKDNDGDGATDCADGDCVALTVCIDGTDSEEEALSGIPFPPVDDVPKPSGTPGNLVVLDWAGFTSAVSYSFDDGNQSQKDKWSDIMGLGVHFTFYLVPDWNDENADMWKDAVEAGHEIGNHTKNHDCSTIAEGNQILEAVFGKIYTLAAPNGSSACAEPAKQYHIINRMVNGGIVKPNDSTDPFLLPSYIPASDADADAFNRPAELAHSQGGWAVYCIHGFTGDANAWQPFPYESFADGVHSQKSHGDVWLDSIVNVGSYWIAQKMLSSVTPSSEGENTVWTWTLPEHFPPGKYLRVKVDGGTLKQGDTEIPWSSHGFYEVSLDAGSLTLSP